MRKLMPVVALLLFAISFLSNPGVTSAQEASKESNSANATATETVNAYRVDLSFNEMEDGKKVNSRHYSIDLTGGRENVIKIGTRIPIATSSINSASSQAGSVTEQYQYIDLGTSVWAQLINHGQELRISSEISSVDTSAGSDTTARLGPVLRQIKIEGSTALILGKPILIGVADDPNSKRQFQLEATVTKLN